MQKAPLRGNQDLVFQADAIESVIIAAVVTNVIIIIVIVVIAVIRFAPPPRATFVADRRTHNDGEHNVNITGQGRSVCLIHGAAFALREI